MRRRYGVPYQGTLGGSDGVVVQTAVPLATLDVVQLSLGGGA